MLLNTYIECSSLFPYQCFVSNLGENDLLRFNYEREIFLKQKMFNTSCTEDIRKEPCQMFLNDRFF